MSRRTHPHTGIEVVDPTESVKPAHRRFVNGNPTFYQEQGDNYSNPRPRSGQYWTAVDTVEGVVGGGEERAARRREPVRRPMRPVSWAHMATSTRFRAPSFRMRLARCAVTVLGVI